MIKKIIANHKSFPLEIRMFNVIVLVLSLIGLLGAYQNYVLKLDAITIYPSLVGSMVCWYVFYLSALRKAFKEYFVYILFAIEIIIVSIVFFYNSGSAGPILLLHSALFIALLLISNGKHQYLLFLIFIINVLALYFIEYKFDTLYDNYKNSNERFWDVSITFLNSITLITISIIVFKKSYNNERRKLEKSILEINEKNDLINVLVKEINHRVKNNLQVVSSLLNMQAMSQTSEESKNLLELARNRVLAIGLIHKNFDTEAPDLSINLSSYLFELCSNLVNTYDPDIQLKYHFKPEELRVKVEQGVHIGLIINELISNAIKYAWNKDDSIKVISIESKLTGKNQLSLNISDNGRGIPKKVNLKKTESLGFQIIHSIVEHYNGTITQLNKKGAKFQLILSLKNNDESNKE